MKINDKVICIGNLNAIEERYKIFHPVLPEKGKVYVIREVRELGIKNCPLKGILLVGIDSLNNTYGREQAFNSFDFQLLEDHRKNKQNFGGEYDWLNKDES